jgi:Arc/MetJ family transcription regulator
MPTPGGTRTIQRTTLDIDVDELRRAQAVLGTSTKRDTVNEALREVNRLAALRKAADRLREGGLNIVRPEDLPKLRRTRA